MGIGMLRRHAGYREAGAADAPKTREQLLEERLAAETARADALQAELAARGAQATSAALEAEKAAGRELAAAADALALKLDAAEKELAALRSKARGPADVAAVPEAPSPEPAARAARRPGK